MNNILITLSGPSGAGKTTLERLLEEKLDVRRLISTTTRPQRGGEAWGKDYFFVTPEVFEERREHMVEAKEFNGNWYGLERGQLGGEQEVLVLVVEPVGAAWYKAYAHTLDLRVVSLYVDCPEVIVAQRLAQRADDGKITVEQADERLKHYRDVEQGMGELPWFDFQLPEFGPKNEEGVMKDMDKLIGDLKKVHFNA